eukprot:301203_1
MSNGSTTEYRSWISSFRCVKCKIAGKLEFWFDWKHKQSRSYTWWSKCTACSEVSEVGTAPEYPAKSREFRGPSLDACLAYFVPNESRFTDPTFEIVNGKRILNLKRNLNAPDGFHIRWKNVSQEHVKNAEKKLRQNKPLWRNVNLMMPNVPSLGVKLPEHDKSSRPDLIRKYLKKWFPKRLLPPQAVPDRNIRYAKKLGLLLPWFDKSMARDLFRTMLKVPPHVTSPSTDQLGIIFASMLSLWMPDEIPIVAEAFCETVLDPVLCDYQAHFGMAITWWVENVWSINVPFYCRAPVFVDYAWICMQCALREVFESVESGNCPEIVSLNNKILHVTRLMAALVTLRARWSMADIGRGTSLGLYTIQAEIVDQNYVEHLESFELPIRKSDPGVKWCLNQFRKMRLPKQVERVKSLIRQSEQNIELEREKLGQVEFDKKTAAEKETCAEFVRKCDKLSRRIKRLGFEGATDNCARTLLKWYSQRKCQNCARTMQISLSRQCGRCRSVSYCSSDCQKEDWKQGHRNKCTEKVNKSDK